MPTPKAITDMGSILVTVSRDTTAPGLPGVPTLVSNAPTTIVLDWTAALDNAGGSGIKGYDVERAGAVIASQVPKGYTDTQGLNPATSYSYRVRAIDNAGNVGNFGPSALLATAGINQAPVWNGAPSPSFIQGTASSYSLVGLASDAESDPITFTSIGTALPSGVTINNSTKALDYNGVGAVATATGIRLHATATGGTADSATFSITISAAATNSLLQDWTNRSTANGVLWAHKFDDPATVEKFLGATDRPTARQFIFQNPGDGILGDGCLEMRWPQGGQPQYAWIRSIFPTPGDVNKPGWEVLPLQNYAHFHPEMFVNYQGGGHVVHSDYLAGSPGTSPPGPQIVRNSKIYLAYAVKFSASRMADIENTNPSGNGTGKYMMLSGWYANCNQEIVSQITTSYGGGWYNQYTNVGSGPNAFLRNPQDGAGNALIQPGGGHDATCFANGPLPLGGQSPANNQNCWTFPADRWVHILHVITPGRKAANLNAGWLTDPANAGAKNTGIEVYYAYPGDSSWTAITSYPSFIFEFAGDYLGVANGQPYGWSVVNFTPFNGGATTQPVMSPQGYFHRFDQIICSTQPIAVPADYSIPTWYQ